MKNLILDIKLEILVFSGVYINFIVGKLKYNISKKLHVLYYYQPNTIHTIEFFKDKTFKIDGTLLKNFKELSNYMVNQISFKATEDVILYIRSIQGYHIHNTVEKHTIEKDILNTIKHF